MIGLQRISLGEPLENIAHLARPKSRRGTRRGSTLDIPHARLGAIYGDLGERALDDQ
jgi:hypothetical protein